MKKIIISCVSAILLISCFIVGIVGNGVRVGAGFGFGDSIKSPDDLIDLLEFVAADNGNRSLRFNDSSEGMFQKLKFSDDDDDDNEKYTSVTVDIDTNMSYEASGTSISLDRNMKMYITESGVFYSSKGTMYTNSAAENYVMSVIFDVDVYKTDDEVYFCFKEYSIASKTENVQIRNEYKSKWIEISEDMVFDIVDSADSQNQTTLSLFGDIISVLIDEEEFKDGDKLVKLDKKQLNDVLSKGGAGNLGLSGEKIDFRVDLSSADKPSVLLSIDKTMESFAFCNINNTVISFNESSVDITEDDYDDPEDLFLIAK